MNPKLIWDPDYQGFTSKGGADDSLAAVFFFINFILCSEPTRGFSPLQIRLRLSESLRREEENIVNLFLNNVVTVDDANALADLREKFCSETARMEKQEFKRKATKEQSLAASDREG